MNIENSYIHTYRFSLADIIWRIEVFLFYVLMFSMPFQRRYIFHSWGVGFNEWNAVFVYATDVLIIVLLLFWVIRATLFKKKVVAFASYDLWFVGFLVIAALSLFHAGNVWLGVFRLLKFFEFFLLYLYIKSNISLLDSRKVFSVFIVSAVLQALVGISQFILKHDLGLRVFGESPLSLDLSNIAAFFSMHGEKILRAYGTFPHPNVLAVFLFCALFAIYELRQRKRYVTLAIALPIILAGFLLTFSRLPLVLAAFGSIVYFFQMRKKVSVMSVARFLLLGIVVFGITTVMVWPALFAKLESFGGDESLTLRKFYLSVALQQPNTLFGVGVGNFVPWFMQHIPNLAPYLYQPVHNIFLLLYAELGIIGITLFALFFVFLWRDIFKNTTFYIPRFTLCFFLFSFLLLGLFDHYFLSLQQGQLLFWGLLGILATRRSTRID